MTSDSIAKGTKEEKKAISETCSERHKFMAFVRTHTRTHTHSRGEGSLLAGALYRRCQRELHSLERWRIQLNSNGASTRTNSSALNRLTHSLSTLNFIYKMFNYYLLTHRGREGGGGGGISLAKTHAEPDRSRTPDGHTA